MTIKTGAIKSGTSEIYPHTALDQIRKSASSSTTLIASGGKILAAFMDLQSGISTTMTDAQKAKAATAGGVLVISSSLASYITNTSSALNSKNNLKQDKMSAGFGMIISGGTQVALARQRAITTVPAASTTVTLEPGEAYVVDATTTSKTFEKGTAVTTGHFGLESHIELFVANEGYVHVGSNVTLVDALEPDAVNDCTVRFHDGHAIISVEDHVAAYMVNNTSTSYVNGTLAYGLGQTGNTASNYIGFRSELNGSSVPTGGQSATNLKHIVGNGMDVGPTITGNLIVKSGATIRDVKLSGVTVISGDVRLDNVQLTGNVAVSGGTMTMSYVYIPSGSTVAVSGGGLAVEKVSGNGGVVDLGGTRMTVSSGFTANASDCVFTGGNAGNVQNGGVFGVLGGAQVNMSGCTASGNIATRGGVFSVSPGGIVSAVNCAFIGNTGSTFAGVLYGTANATFSSCTFSGNTCISNPRNAINNNGTTTLVDCVLDGIVNGSGTVNVGGTLDLTGNMNATPINPGGKVIVDGGCTVITSAGTTVSIAGGTYTKIKNDGTTA